MDDQIQFRGTIERDFENILSKAGIPGGFVAPIYDSRFIVAHVSMCKVLPAELSHMIMKGKLPLSEDIGWVNPWLRSALIFTRIRSYQ